MHGPGNLTAEAVRRATELGLTITRAAGAGEVPPQARGTGGLRRCRRTPKVLNQFG